MTTVYFATSAAHAALTADDHVVTSLLAEHGISARPLVWTESIARIPPSSLIVLRSVWDYHLHPEDFLAWLAALEAAGHRVLNSPALVRWNIDKRYLLNLAAAGVVTIPTCWVSRGSVDGLDEAVHALGCDKVVVKPAVSASAFDTHRLDLGTNRDQARRLFVELSRRHDLLVQPYLPEITGEGEWSLVFIDGGYSHSVRKRPAPDDFRVQVDFGGSIHADSAPDHVRTAAARVVASVPETPLYARIDGVIVDGRFLLMEAECIDPVLYFRSSGEGAVRFATSLARTATVHACGRATS